MRVYCIGFGKYERVCKKKLTNNDNPNWCQRCDKLRRDHITNQLENMVKGRN